MSIMLIGEFATQTCFQGRFGEEIGSSQYGSQIMVHPPRPDEDIAKARIEFVEITFAGQAFRMGRYAVCGIILNIYCVTVFHFPS